MPIKTYGAKEVDIKDVIDVKSISETKSNKCVTIKKPKKKQSEKDRTYASHDDIIYESKCTAGRYFVRYINPEQNRKNGKGNSYKEVKNQLENNLLFAQLVDRAFPSFTSAKDWIRIFGFALWELSQYSSKDIICYTKDYRDELHNGFNSFRGRVKDRLKH